MVKKVLFLANALADKTLFGCSKGFPEDKKLVLKRIILKGYMKKDTRRPREQIRCLELS